MKPAILGIPQESWITGPFPLNLQFEAFMERRCLKKDMNVLMDS